jgi:site-specific DNA-methyltransferase (adenine-specific)
VVPYYQDELVTLYHGDCREVTEWLAADVLVTDPPYPNGAGHFVDSIGDAKEALALAGAFRRLVVFWSHTERPPISAPLVALHGWHRSNSNRFDNYEAIYEFSDDGAPRSSHIWSLPVIHPALTGCKEATGHPTQKPLKLLTGILSLSRFEGAIADPFAGSGTTLVAAKQLGRRAIGVELDESYCEVIAKRLAQGVLDFAPVSSREGDGA